MKNSQGSCGEYAEKVSQNAKAFMDDFALRSIRSLQGLVGSDRACVPIMVANELSRQPGWGDIDPVYITATANHGHGGGKTFKVSAPPGSSASPPEVAVHICEHGAWTSALSRVSHASAEFASAGLAPARIAQGDNFYIEAWEGQGHPDMKSSDYFNDLGGTFAKIHSLPTQWFDRHRDQMICQFPPLLHAQHGSHVWCFLHPAFEHDLSVLSEDVLQAFVEAPLLAPVNAIASRIVTCHMDFHPQNSLKTDNGLMCIDFESACVTCAAADLALAVALAGHVSGDDFSSALERKRAVVKSYLETLGESSSSADVDDLIFEAEMARASYLHGHLIPGKLHGPPQTAIRIIDAMVSFISRARESSTLRARIIEAGFKRCAAEDGALEAAQNEHNAHVMRLINGQPSLSASTDAGISDSDSSENFPEHWGLPLGIQDMALPLGFHDAGLRKEFA